MTESVAKQAVGPVGEKSLNSSQVNIESAMSPKSTIPPEKSAIKAANSLEQMTVPQNMAKSVQSM